MAEPAYQSSSAATYLYDGQGERVAQQVTQAGSTTTTIYVGDVEEVSTVGSTTQTTTYYYANGKRIALGVNGQISYLASDALGSATLAFGSSGAATASQLFAPYGGVRYSNGIMPTSFGFTGQRGDSLSGLNYFHARYLDPVLGQFTSADKLLQGGGFDILGLSRYVYVEGNPIRMADPTGHDACIDDGMGGCVFPDPGVGGDSPPPDPAPAPDPCWSCLDPGYNQATQPAPDPVPSDPCPEGGCYAPPGGNGPSDPPLGSGGGGGDPIQGITCGCSGGSSTAPRPPDTGGDSSDRYGHFLNPNPVAAGLNNEEVALDLTYQTLELVSFIPYTQYWVSWELQRHVVRPATERGVLWLFPARGLLWLSQRVGLSADEFLDNGKNPIEHRLGLGNEPEGDEGFIGHIGPHQTGPVRYLPGKHPDGTEDIVW